MEDNLTDYAQLLSSVKGGSLLEELDEISTQAWLKSMVKNSVGFMALARCGYDPLQYYTGEDFSRLYDFNTLETVSVLGDAGSDISEMILREIEIAVRTLRREEKNPIRTFANERQKRDTIPRNEERSDTHGSDTDLPAGGGLPSAQRSTPGGPEGGQVWDAAAGFPAGSPEAPLHRDAPERETEPHLEEVDRQAKAMMDSLIQQMARAEKVTESLKASNQMLWVQSMNSIRNRAEERVLHELIYS